MRVRTAWAMVVLIVGAGLAPGILGAADDRSMRQAFETLDGNGDGIVSQEEFDQNKVKVFFSTLEEFRRDRMLSFEETRLSRAAFDDADTNGDGKLAGAEWVLAPFAQYTTYDPDGDGAITYEEFAAGIAPFLRQPSG
jgi:Ca2+-binding EF-hand superfamily protein